MATDAKVRSEEILRVYPGDYAAQSQASVGQQTERLKEEISRFNPYCEPITYTTLGCLAGSLRAALNDGPAGIGKSRSTVELARLFPRLDGVQVLNGHITPLAMYKLLWDCRAKTCVLIVDESFTLLADREIQQMLRCAMYSGQVDWRSKGKATAGLGLPESFRFNGRVIFNTNVTNQKDFNYKAMLDRVFYNKLMLTGEQIAEKMKTKRSYSPDRELWKLVEERLLLIRDDKTDITLSTAEQEAILKYTVDGILRISRTYNVNISMRILERVEWLCLFLKQFFGELDLEFAKGLADNYFVVNDEEDLIKKVIARNGGSMPAKDLAAILRDTQKYSLRTAQRRINEYVELGRISTPKRGVVALLDSPAPAPPAPPTPEGPGAWNSEKGTAILERAWKGFCP